MKVKPGQYWESDKNLIRIDRASDMDFSYSVIEGFQQNMHIYWYTDDPFSCLREQDYKYRCSHTKYLKASKTSLWKVLNE